VDTSNESCVRYVGQLLRALDPENQGVGKDTLKPVDLAALSQALVAINVGLESFKESLVAQHVQVIQVDWRPAASGDEKLMNILERMKSK
jgi:FdrA protein